MIEPTEKDIGRSVIYTGNYNGPLQRGRITSFNDSVVFVRYTDQHLTAYGQATNRKDLKWA